MVCALHVFFAAFVWHQMKPHGTPAVVHVRVDDALTVRLISHAPSVAPPPVPLAALPAAASPPRVSRPVIHEAPAKNAMTVTLPATSASAPTHPALFDSNGQIILPTSAATTPPPPEAGYVQHMPQGDTQIMHDADTVHEKQTRFAGAWQNHSSTVNDLLQKAVEKTTMKTTINLPKGVRIHCAVSLAMLAGGCGGDPPPPPPSNDGDERLNMAATPLSKGIAKPTPPSVADCIADYLARKPLPYGCPVDTPNRAVDAERHTRDAPQAKQGARPQP
jgi:hypothetical protein